MRSSFAGIEMMRSGLMASQAGIELAGHNVANANTPGYSRQRIHMEAVVVPTNHSRYAMVKNALSQQGVTVGEVQRVRDGYLDIQYRDATSNVCNHDVNVKALGMLEKSLLEGDHAGIHQAIGNLFDSMQNLTLSAGANDKLLLVRQEASDMVSVFRRDAKLLDDMTESQFSQMKLRCEEVNTLSENIAQLNKDIKEFEKIGMAANDLRDKRDYMLDQLSTYVDIKHVENADGTIDVNIGSESLVAGETFRTMETVENADGSASLIWQDTSAELTDISGGYLMGHLEVLNGGRGAGFQGGTAEGIPAQRIRLDAIAKAVIDNLNALNQAGICPSTGAAGGDLFSGSNASDISLSANWSNDITALATSQGGAVGDNLNLLKMIEFRGADVNFGYYTGTLEEGCTDWMTSLGSSLNSSAQRQESATAMQGAVDFQRQSVSSVSLDEEMVNIIKYQQAYTAVSRVITTMDEMLDVLVNRTGLAGR